MSTDVLAQIGGALAATGLAVLILRPSRVERIGGVAAWALGLALFVPLLVPEGQEWRLALGAALALVVALGLALLFRRWPWLVALVALAAAPARIPVTVGDTTANLLLPLYVVVAAAVAVLGWSLLRDPERSRELGPLAWPLALLVLWLGASGLWTNDVRAASITLFFYVLPFAALAVSLSRLPWSPRPVAWLYGLLAAMALVFAAVGIWQWSVRDIFWNPKVIVGNAYAPFYRVNSVFWDPSIYGRFLVVAILVSVVLLLFRTGRGAGSELAIAGLVAAVSAGLFVSFSQSSFAALAAGLVLAAALAWRWRAAAAVALVAAVMIPVGVAAPQLERVRHAFDSSSPETLNRATRGRFKLVANGLRIAQDHPVAGVGVGGFEGAYADRLDRPKPPPSAASHNTPVTVAAETGLVGVVLLAWLVAATLLLALRGNGVGARAPERTALALGLAFAAIFVHSLFYNAFFEDPMTWGLVGLIPLAVRAREPAAPASG